jgi:hypothetical protein
MSDEKPETNPFSIINAALSALELEPPVRAFNGCNQFVAL